MVEDVFEDVYGDVSGDMPEDVSGDVSGTLTVGGSRTICRDNTQKTNHTLLGNAFRAEPYPVTTPRKHIIHC